MSPILKEKLRNAIQADSSLLCDRSKLDETLGHDAHYLEEVLCLTKNDLIRLERLGLALKARYGTENRTFRGLKGVTGPHRIRWIIFQEVKNYV